MLKWLDFKITNRCNRRCLYCGVPHDLPSDPELLSSDTIASTLEDALANGFTHFALLGGEPSLRADIPRIFAPFHGEARAKVLMVITNGVVFNETLYRSLFETNAEEATLVFSCDSLRRPNYKSQDPAKSLHHIRAIQGLAREYDGREGRRTVSVHTVISRENFRDVDRHVATFRAMDVDVSLGLVCPAQLVPEGEASRYNEFTHKELEQVIEQMESMDQRGVLNFANHTLLEYLRLFPTGFLNLAPSCRAGSQVAIINPNGDVFPCVPASYLGGQSFGNIMKEPFSIILTRLMDFTCDMVESSACWDHFLWDKLAERAG